MTKINKFYIVRYKPSQPVISDVLQNKVELYWKHWNDLMTANSEFEFEVYVVLEPTEDKESWGLPDEKNAVYVFVPMDYIVLQHQKYIFNWLKTNTNYWKKAVVRFSPDLERELNYVMVASDLDTAVRKIFETQPTKKKLQEETRTSESSGKSHSISFVLEGYQDGTCKTPKTLAEVEAGCYSNFTGNELFALPTDKCTSFEELLEQLENQLCEPNCNIWA